MPKFSIIIPVYNVAPYLRECLGSVLAQTCADWEAICVDDGSADESGAILDVYANMDRRFKILHQKNQGVVAAREAGYKISRGEWILFLDGDDELCCNCLETLKFQINNNCCDMIEFGYDFISLAKNLKKNVPISNGLLSFDNVVEQSKNSPLDVLGMCIGNKCYRHHLVECTFSDIGDVRISHSEDGLFAFSAFLHAEKILFIKESLYKYKIREGSALGRVNVNIVREKEVFIKRIENLAKRSCRLSDLTIGQMLNFHSYEACCYIFLMLARNKASISEIMFVISQLKDAEFFQRKNTEIITFKRKLMYLLLRHPFIYIIFLKAKLIR